MKKLLLYKKIDANKILVLIIFGLFIGPNIVPGNSELITQYTKEEINPLYSFSPMTITIQKMLSPPLDEIGYNDEIKSWEHFYQRFFSDENIISFGTEVLSFPLGTKVIDVNCSYSSYETMHISNKPTLLYKQFLGKHARSSSKEYYYHTGGGLKDNEHVTYLSIYFTPQVKLTQGKINYPTQATIEVTYEEPLKTNNEGNNTFDFLIITPAEFTANLQPLVEHKNNHHIATKLVTLEEINGEGRDKQEQIKYYIKDAIEKWNISSVLLVGNEEKMPVRYSYANNETLFLLQISRLFISDLYYADVYDSNGSFCSWDTNNNDKFGETKNVPFDDFDDITIIIDKVDLYPDVHIGRLPCANASELDTVVDKIIRYENTPADDSWFKNLILFGGNDFSVFHAYGAFFQLREEDIVDNFFDFRPVWEGIHLCDKVSELMNDFTAKKFYSSAVFPFLVKSDDIQIPDAEYINQAFNQGAGFALLTGHGNTKAVGAYLPTIIPDVAFMYIYSKSDIQNLSNKDKLPIVMLNGCSIGDFSSLSGIPSPFAWEIVKLKSGGAIASFAFTSMPYAFPGSLYIETLNGFLVYHLFKAYKNGKETPGEMLTASITDYLNDEKAMYMPPDPFYRHYCDLEMFSLFGDPTLKIGGYNI